MPEFRRKPATVQAEQVRTLLNQVRSNWSHLPDWFNDLYEAGKAIIYRNHIAVDGKGGLIDAEINDYLVCNAQGEVQVMKAEDFRAEYELVLPPLEGDDGTTARDV
ncbi:hypothetical protein EON80_30435 [bacterium]|nr:MAG: hypothetical protein EON80_30435 [bacterium]